MFHILRTAILTFILSSRAFSCPSGIGWISAGETCYLVSSEHMNWFVAQEVKLIQHHNKRKSIEN